MIRLRWNVRKHGINAVGYASVSIATCALGVHCACMELENSRWLRRPSGDAFGRVLQRETVRR